MVGLDCGRLALAAAEFVPSAARAGEWWRAFTATWLHADPAHLAMNAILGALLLGVIPLSFAAAVVRYRLTDVEVIIKRGLAVASVGLGLVIIYYGAMLFAGFVFRTNADENNVMALLAQGTLQVVEGAAGRQVFTPADQERLRELLRTGRGSRAAARGRAAPGTP